jgi:hypothetical protein
VLAFSASVVVAAAAAAAAAAVQTGCGLGLGLLHDMRAPTRHTALDCLWHGTTFLFGPLYWFASGARFRCLSGVDLLDRDETLRLESTPLRTTHRPRRESHPGNATPGQSRAILDWKPGVAIKTTLNHFNTHPCFGVRLLASWSPGPPGSALHDSSMECELAR